MKFKRYQRIITLVLILFLGFSIFYYYYSPKRTKITIEPYQDSDTINLVTFYSEGPPNDNGLDLSINKDKILKQIEHFDNIALYTPKILKDLGLDNYVKEYEKTGLVTRNKGMSKIGFCAWRPKIMLLELEKMNEGDILLYRDMNIKKYPLLGNYGNIRNVILTILDIVKFDFFVSREHLFNIPLQLKNYAKTNVIRELGDDHPFTYNFPNLIADFIIVRKSNVSIQLLKEWENACLKEEWINGEQYGELHPSFRWSCPEQSILGVIMANWVRKKIHNIPEHYPFIGIPFIGIKGRNINNMFLYDKNRDYDYLDLLK